MLPKNSSISAITFSNRVPAILLRATRTVELEGRQVEYASFAEMERRLHAVERELAKQQKRHGSRGFTP